MSEALIEDLDRGTALPMRLNGPNATFVLGTETIRGAAMASIDPAIEDLLEIACAVFFADGAVSRGGDTRRQMGAEWRRHIRVTIPVRNPEVWSDPAVVDSLADTVQFLTDDDVEFRFIAHDGNDREQGYLDLLPGGRSFDAGEVILFSGGLDSFAGALEALSTSRQNILLVSHRSAQKVLPRQDALAEFLADRFPRRLLHVRVEARRAGPEAQETTQRSRSLLFAALGQAVAHSFGAGRVSFYENGVVSHNLPISPQVVGTMASRTTHPLAILKLNHLVNLVAPGAPKISNGYEWLTKTEVVQRIAQYGGAGEIRRAVSCTSVRDQTLLHPHCGRCSQCLDRRFGVLAAGLVAEDPPEGYKTDVLLGPRHQPKSTTMAVEWTRHAIRLRNFDPRTLISAFGLEVSRIVKGHPELEPEEALRRVLDLHRRHSEAVRRVLVSAIQDWAEDLALGKVDPTSLLVLHMGQDRDKPLRLPDDPRDTVAAIPVDRDVAEEDLAPDPDGPLVAAFFEEDGIHVVAVEGLGRVQGSPAKVAHGLKREFDLDRSNGLPPDNHRFVVLHMLPGYGSSKEMARKNVSRCRALLAADYRRLFGVDPPRPLLIQNKPREGYRLDPLTRITTHHP